MTEITLGTEKFRISDNNYECSPIFEEVGDKVTTQDGTDHIEGCVLKRGIKSKDGRYEARGYG